MTDHQEPEPLAIDSLDGPLITRLSVERTTLFARATTLVLGLGFLSVAFGMVLVFRGTNPIITFILGFSFVAAGFWGALQIEQRAESRQKNKIKRVLSEASPVEYFERLVNINVENLSAYYVTVKGHANKSFLAALFVGFVGFALIGSGIGLALNDAKHGPSVSLLAGISGVATELISAVFFYLYSQTVRQMKEYHDSLLAVQNVLLSFKLVGDTSDPAEKVKMIGKMLEYLVGKSSNFGSAEKPTSLRPPKNRSRARAEVDSRSTQAETSLPDLS